jgi:phosphoglycolate phosphatase
MSRQVSLLVDLDGTIVEPEAGIIGSVRHALDELGVAPKPGDDLRWVIGPPLRTVLPKIGVPADQVERGVALYRERYTGGLMYDAEVYDGMREALSALRDDGFRMFICTSKPHVYARKIAAHFGVLEFFEELHGAELNGVRDNKGDLIAHMLALYGIEPDDAIMIGDTPFDVEGARQNGMRCVGVSWGHGQERLAAANPAAICERPADLLNAVRRLAREPA